MLVECVVRIPAFVLHEILPAVVYRWFIAHCVSLSVHASPGGKYYIKVYESINIKAVFKPVIKITQSFVINQTTKFQYFWPLESFYRQPGKCVYVKNAINLAIALPATTYCSYIC